MSGAAVEFCAFLIADLFCTLADPVIGVLDAEFFRVENRVKTDSQLLFIVAQAEECLLVQQQNGDDVQSSHQTDADVAHGPCQIRRFNGAEDAGAHDKQLEDEE